MTDLVCPMCGMALEPHQRECPSCGEGNADKTANAERVWRAFRRNTAALAIYWLMAGGLAVLLSTLLGAAVFLPQIAPIADGKPYLAFVSILHGILGLGLLSTGRNLLKRRSVDVPFGIWMNYGLIFACLTVLNAATALIAILAVFKSWSVRQQIGRIRGQQISPDLSMDELSDQLQLDVTLADRVDRSQFD
jgi:hypothetical protein